MVFGIYSLIRLIILVKSDDKSYYTKEQYLVGFTSAVTMIIGTENFLVFWVTLICKYSSFISKTKTNIKRSMPLGLMTFMTIDTIYQSIQKQSLFTYPMQTSDWQWKILSFNFSSIIFINYASFVVLIIFVVIIIILAVLGKLISLLYSSHKMQ